MALQTLFEDRFPRLWRSLAVLGQAWRERKADDKQRGRSDREFLAPALEILETPPSPLGRAMLWTLTAMVAIALAWAIFGRLDVIAVAQGRTIPSANSKIVQAFDIGSIRAIYVHEGQRVRKGQLLIALDPTLAAANQGAADETLQAHQLEDRRNAALLSYIDGRGAVFTAPPGTPNVMVVAQNRLIAAAIAEYEANRASLEKQRLEAVSDRDVALQEVAKLRDTLPIEAEQLRGRRALAAKGYFAGLRLMDYEQQLLQHQRDLQIQRAAVAKATAAIGQIDAEIAKLRGGFARTASTAQLDAQRDAGVARGDAQRNARLRELTQIRAPIDGVVEQLMVTTVGGVVKPADPLMTIVPTDAPVVLDARLLNRDIGFVQVGQRARVKFQAFPFTDYGAVDGVVERIGRDSIEDEKAGPVFAVRIRLLSDHLALTDGHSERLGAGLTATAEIRTGSRPIIRYLLSPLARRANEAGRER
ncbi:Membrane fusion protein (MFP) family protein [Sphingomonas antarctica]|uniref:HlyD family type I secretion periplasmic adaptor subunit n=1 Tax=Sphingomonas antarctica TaxID=2040274 RepID=UPI0039E8CCBC